MAEKLTQRGAMKQALAKLGTDASNADLCAYCKKLGVDIPDKSVPMVKYAAKNESGNPTPHKRRRRRAEATEAPEASNAVLSDLQQLLAIKGRYNEADFNQMLGLC
jgi:hypothetical protein